MRFIPAILGLIAISPALAAQDCQSIGLAVRDISSIGAVATEFCGSFLGIPATVTSVVTETPTQFVTVALPATTVTAGNCPNKTAKKRDIAAIPTGLDKYSDNVLSSACSRLSLKPTVTTTITGIASIAVTSIVTAPAATATVCNSCTPVGGPCDIQHPEMCCSGACMCPRNKPNCECFSWQ